MKKIVSAFLCILFCTYLLCGCSVHKKNVVYFGYFNGDEKNQSGEYYTEELSQTNHANIVFVSNNDAVTEAWKNRLEMVLNFPEEVFSTQEDGSLYLSNFWKARYRQYALLDVKSPRKGFGREGRPSLCALQQAGSPQKGDSHRL